MKIRTHLMVLLMVITGLGCGKRTTVETDDLDETTAERKALRIVPDKGTVRSPEVVSIAAAQGNWASKCTQNNDDFLIYKVTFTETTATFTETMYGNDRKCQEANQIGTTTIETTFVMASSISKIVPSATHIDFTPTSAGFVIQSTDALKYFNDQQICQKSDWVGDKVSNDITLLDNCPLNPFGKKGDLFYTLINITTDKLYLGQKTVQLNGNTPDTRPIAFNAFAYLKSP